MNRTSLYSAVLLGTSLALGGCNAHDAKAVDKFLAKTPPTTDKATPRPELPAKTPPATASTTTSTNATGGAGAAPITPVNPSDEIPLGPYFPPAQSTVAPAPTNWSYRSVKARIERWFKDAIPAGENRSLHPTTVTEEEEGPRRRNLTADQLRPALALNTANGELIAKILRTRSSSDVTAKLKDYLTAEDPKTAASAAELVIENVFAYDLQPSVKLYELAGDFDEIQRMGYYDEAIAGRREFLQARLDQVWKANKAWSADLPTAILIDVVPALAVGILAGYQVHAIEGVANAAKVGVRGASQGSRAVGRLAGEGGESLLQRLEYLYVQLHKRPQSEIVGEKLADIGLAPMALRSDSIREIQRRMVVDGVKHKLQWVETPDRKFRYAVTPYYNGVRNNGAFVVFDYHPMGRSRVAMTNELGSDQIAGIERAIANSHPPTVSQLTAKGVEPSPLPAEALAPSTGAHQPRAVRDFVEDGADQAGPVVAEAGPKAQAYPLDGKNPNVRIVDDVGAEAPPAKGPGAASNEGTIYRQPLKFDVYRGAAGFVLGGAAMTLPAMVAYRKGARDGADFEVLYLGGQYEKYVPTPKTPVGDKPVQTSEAKVQ